MPGTEAKRSEIARSARQSAGLKRELRLPDRVLLQVLLIVGLPWIGYAAKLGGAHVVLWMAGIALFYFPLAGTVIYFSRRVPLAGCVPRLFSPADLGGSPVVLWMAAIALFYFPLAGTVIYLSRRLPLEGGIYQWAKIGLSPFAGFQSAWNYSFFLILMYATSGSLVANSLSYLRGPDAAWMTSYKPLILGLNVAFFAIVLWVNVRGLHLARWITSTGGALVIALYALIIGLLALRLLRGEPLAQPTVTLVFPALTLMTVNLFSKIAFNALSGFEQVAIFAGECHTPERNIARSVWIAGPATIRRANSARVSGTGA